MADFPFIVDINEQNLTEILQQSLEKRLVINFYAPTHKESSDFLALLELVAEQYQGQFVLGKVNCEKRANDCRTIPHPSIANYLFV